MDYQFQIGDLVEHVTAGVVDGRAIPGVVLEQRSQTCPGGTQHHYLVRFGLNDKHHVCLNVELRPHVPESELVARDDIETLEQAKCVAVVNRDFEVAAGIRDLIDRMKKERRAAEQAKPSEPTP